MKTKNLILTLILVIATASLSLAQTAASSGNWMNSFSFSEYLLMTLCTIMLAVIWVLSKTIKSLTDQLR